jgi:hypothetical protein
MRYLRPLCLALAGFAWGAAPAGAAQDLPIFDAHIHYGRIAWDAYPPESVFAILDRAGVTGALVSSTPDEGTLRLREKAPGRIVAEVRPYRSPDDMGSWTRDTTRLPYVEERLKRGIYRGIGEFHLGPGAATHPVPRGFVELAARYRVFLHCHCDETAIEELARMRQDVRVLWAHAGMGAPAATVERLLDRYPNLWAELALRTDVASGGALDPAWRALFLKHADRFLVGTDTWVNSQWDRLPEIHEGTRAWLRQLPPDVAARIAHGNGDRLFRVP